MNRDRAFVCSKCKETFITAWNEEAAQEEYERIFGEEADPNPAMLCEDCWQDFQEWAATEAPHLKF